VARQRGFQPRSQRRKTAWGFGPDSTGQTISASGKQFLTTSVALSGQQEATIVRIRGFLELLLITSGGAEGGFQGAFGIALTTTEAVAAGVASVPGPVTDAEWDGWIVHRFFSIHTVTATIADGVNAAGVRAAYEIDSKAMRKMNDGQALFAVMESTEVPSSSLRMHFDSRVLLMLS